MQGRDGSMSGQREKSSSDADLTIASGAKTALSLSFYYHSDPRGSSGASVALQGCTKCEETPGLCTPAVISHWQWEEVTVLGRSVSLGEAALYR